LSNGFSVRIRIAGRRAKAVELSPAATQREQQRIVQGFKPVIFFRGIKAREAHFPVSDILPTALPGKEEGG
jgi:hypothetical protein